MPSFTPVEPHTERVKQADSTQRGSLSAGKPTQEPLTVTLSTPADPSLLPLGRGLHLNLSTRGIQGQRSALTLLTVRSKNTDYNPA